MTAATTGHMIIKADGRLLGAAMACVKAENLAHLIAWSIQQGMNVQDMLKMPFYHPVIEEALQAALYNAMSQLDVEEELVERFDIDLERFDPETQAMAIYYYVEEMSQEEVAEALGRSVPTVRLHGTCAVWDHK